GRPMSPSRSSGRGNMGQANYSGAKEGIVGLTRTLARDLGRYGVTANAIRPTAGTRLTISPEMAAARARSEAAGIRRAGAMTLSDLQPEMIAPLVVYLATDEAGVINGRPFMVRGHQGGLHSQPVLERAVRAAGGVWT